MRRGEGGEGGESGRGPLGGGVGVRCGDVNLVGDLIMHHPRDDALHQHTRTCLAYKGFYDKKSFHVTLVLLLYPKPTHVPPTFSDK